MLNNEDFERMCLKPQEIFKYLNYNFGDISLWHIDNLQIFDRPFSLYEQKIGNPKTGIAITKAPQSWRYCEYDENNGFLPF